MWHGGLEDKGEALMLDTMPVLVFRVSLFTLNCLLSVASSSSLPFTLNCPVQ